MLTPTYAVTKSFESTLLAIKRSFSVSIHVRRGDFVSLGWCLDIAYYKKAIKLMSDKIQNPVFYVFSDDNEKAKKRQFVIDVGITRGRRSDGANHLYSSYCRYGARSQRP